MHEIVRNAVEAFNRIFWILEQLEIIAVDMIAETVLFKGVLVESNEMHDVQLGFLIINRIVLVDHQVKKTGFFLLFAFLFGTRSD